MTVNIFIECGNRQLITLLLINRNKYIFNVIFKIFPVGFNSFFRRYSFKIFPFRRNIYLNGALDAGFDSGMVHIYNSLTLFAVGCGGCIFHVLHSLSLRNYICNLKESCLKNCINSSAETYLSSYVNTVNDIKINIVIGNIFFHVIRKSLIKFFRRPRTVKKK